MSEGGRAGSAQQEAVFAAFDAWKRGETALAPVTELLDISPVEVGEGSAAISMPAASKLHNAFGAVHGGLLCAMADVAMGLALATVLDGEGFTTLEQSIDHLRATGEGEITARAEVARRGRRSAHLACVLEQDGKEIARASSVCLVFPFA